VSILSENAISMSANDTTLPGPPPDPGPARDGIVSSGWLGSQSIFDQTDERHRRRTMSATFVSFAIHAGLLIAFILAVSVGPQQLLNREPPLEYKVVFLPEVGPGGGGGGSPAPAPPRPIEIPKHKAPAPVPIPVIAPTEPPPTPVLVAPIETSAATILQSSGTSSISLAPLGGGGRGTGMGSGTGSGVGPGTGGGFGGGAYRPGSGIVNPTLLRQEQPKYTSDAMRAKIQGVVELDVVVLENGTVGDVRIAKSLDKTFGLDQEAIIAARKWLFRPGTRQGQPVPIIVRLILEFRLH